MSAGHGNAEQRLANHGRAGDDKIKWKPLRDGGYSENAWEGSVLAPTRGRSALAGVPSWASEQIVRAAFTIELVIPRQPHDSVTTTSASDDISLRTAREPVTSAVPNESVSLPRAVQVFDLVGFEASRR